MSDVLAVRAVDVTKRYGALTALDGISMAVAQGEVYGVLGPNGAGKTTFLRMLFGLIRPDAGTLAVLGRSWPTDGVRTLDGVAGFIESPKFYPYLSGRKNLELLGRLDGLRRRRHDRRSPRHRRSRPPRGRQGRRLQLRDAPTARCRSLAVAIAAPPHPR